MTNASPRFPIYKTKKQTTKNDFQSKYRNEIKEIISGTEYLDQIISHSHSRTRDNQKDENNSRNFNSLTPEAKRQLMFQKPVTLAKRQTKYYSRQPKKPFQTPQKLPHQKQFSYSSQTPVDIDVQIPRFSPISVEETKTQLKASPITSKVNDDNFQATPGHKYLLSQITKTNVEKEMKKSDSDSFESDKQIESVHFSIKNNFDDDLLDHDYKKNEINATHKNRGFNYFQTTFDDQIEGDISDEFSSEKKSDLTNDSSNSESSHSDNVSKNEFSHDLNTLNMISSDAIEAEVKFTSDSSSDNEFQNQFFVQEEIVQPSINNFTDHKTNFISSEAIESLSD